VGNQVILIKRSYIHQLFSQLAHDILYRFQLDYAAEMQFGSREYALVKA